MDAVERAAALREYAEQTSSCTRCALAQGRTQVVFGSGSPDADLMFVGEAPGFHEDQQGVPFVGQAGKLLDKLLGGIGLTRADVFVVNVLKCLRYDARVQLGDGSWERIGTLVRERYGGTVMSVDESGHLVPRRVTGWHEAPLAERRVHRLTYRSAKRVGAGKVSTWLTGDHPVLTDEGYVRADELATGDRVATGQGMSRLALDVVCGTVLGDGHLSAASSYLAFSHSTAQLEYARFKAGLLADLDPVEAHLEVAAAVGAERLYPVVHTRTRAHRALRILRHDFYADHKVAPAWLAHELNERMLAIWFMDDGYLRVRPGGRQPLAEIATVGFDDESIQVLLRGLERLGLRAKASRRRIFFDVATTKRLSTCIAPYVPAPMRYKLHPDVAAAVPFDPTRFERGEQVVLFDEVEVEDVTERAGASRTYFCLDVEETHNFVTAGGVVHNCRPPGNRDPLPEEIAACEPHLFRQIELIEPTLVATLGNFATKLLSGRPQGITRVHGHEQEVTLGSRTVSLYPLYHPAAALYTPSMLKVLEEDFARIPALLERALEQPVAAPEPEAAADPEPEPVQLGLF
jgi:uracil-DNA glycosylase